MLDTPEVELQEDYMYLVKCKLEGQVMVIPCVSVSSDSTASGMVRLKGLDMTINSFKATSITLHPADIEFIAEGSLPAPPTAEPDPQE